jgi:hypothetical protein
MPKQDDTQTMNLFDPDTGDTLSVPISQVMQQIEHAKVFGIPDNVQIPQETVAAIEKQFGTALKFDQDKLPLHLLSTEAMNQTAAVLKFGAQKYAEHNWRAGFAWSRPLAAAMRHITAFNAGEDKDPESGLSHLAHAACCIMFLLEFEKTHKELDDRYKP